MHQVELRTEVMAGRKLPANLPHTVEVSDLIKFSENIENNGDADSRKSGGIIKK
jgi:hypothetical protein